MAGKNNKSLKSKNPEEKKKGNKITRKRKNKEI